MKILTAFACVSALCAYAQEPEAQTITRTLKVGETQTVVLGSNPSTGFAWTLTEEVKVGAPVFVSIDLVGENACEQDAENPCCGAPRDTEVRMTGVHAGVMSFTVQYHRIWEQGVPPLQTCTFVVTVQP